LNGPEAHATLGTVRRRVGELLATAAGDPRRTESLLTDVLAELQRAVVGLRPAEETPSECARAGGFSQTVLDAIPVPMLVVGPDYSVRLVPPAEKEASFTCSMGTSPHLGYLSKASNARTASWMVRAFLSLSCNHSQ